MAFGFTWLNLLLLRLLWFFVLLCFVYCLLFGVLILVVCVVCDCVMIVDLLDFGFPVLLGDRMFGFWGVWFGV